MKTEKKTKKQLNRSRYIKVVWFFFTIFVHAIWWDLVLRKIFLIKSYAASTATKRWRRIARRFRTLALEMGGVLIKLGQFLSIRVDVLPIEITGELADLQDEVPPVSTPHILAAIEAEFGRPADEVFAFFSPSPIAAASLAQAHEAKLANGETVVVKVQRPGIDVLVYTDLAAIEVAVRWLKFYPRVRKRVDLDRLADEFTRITSIELDFIAEGKSCERFAADFADEPALYVPKVYWNYSTGRVLTMENVAYIRIADSKAIDEAGISRAEVAKTFYSIFLRQIFITHFVHADPHPGNLFVRPLDKPAHSSPSDPTPFQIIFIDFGMVSTIPKRLYAPLRQYAIGVGMRDAHKIVQSYVDSKFLLPGADIKRLIEAHEMIFDRFWGIGMTQLRTMALRDAPQLMEEYRDLIYEMPFQVDVDMLFTVRAIGLLSGMATNLDPDFDLWTETIPFAQRLAKEELNLNWQERAVELGGLLRLTTELPAKVDKVLTQAQTGTLSVETSLAPDAKKGFRQLERAAHRLTWAVTSVGLLLAGVLLRTAEGVNELNTGFLVASGIVFVWKVMRSPS